ncbi:MAG: hypothetical protein ACYDBJ_27380 [Aggregatilineales bacterium]
MNSESEWIYERWKLYKLLQEHPNWSLRAYARELKHGPKWVHKWLKRFSEQTPLTISSFKSHSRRPKHSPQRLDQSVKDQIGEWRVVLSERFNRAAGAKTIRYFLKQEQSGIRHVPSLSSIHPVLR